ncbi:MAG: SMC family ATPase [Anaerolineae bacterium]|nr:SMC family ATPase [Anaerolineae bacterium]
MIPQTLAITNFMSYRQSAELNFAGIHLACISGANGAGKSSLLEAMTWALFGKSRSRSDDDVVNRLAASLGESAEIRLVFTLDDIDYRIIRTKKAGGRATLDFQIALPDSGWKTLSEGRLRETQAAIESTLKMNYDTFINASFFLQGQADEFTTKTAGRRKEILADLLGVSQWDVYRDAVAERRKQVENTLHLLDGRLQEIEDELTEQDEREALLFGAQADAERIKAQLDAQETLLTQLRQTAERAQQQQQALQELETGLEKERAKLKTLQGRLTQREQERAQLQTWIAQADAITAEVTQLRSAETDLKTWQSKADAHNALLQQQRPHELTIARTRSRLAEQQKTLQRQAERVTQLSAERDALTVRLTAMQQRGDKLRDQLRTTAEQEAERQTAQAELADLKSRRALLQQELDQLQKQQRHIAQQAAERQAATANLAEATAALERLQSQAAVVQGQRERLAAATAEQTTLANSLPPLREQMEQLRERIDRLSADSGGVCPLCGQELTPAHRSAVLAELEEEGTRLGDTYRANKRTRAALTAEMANLNSDLKLAARVERDLGIQQQRLAATQARLDELDRAQAEWESAGTSDRIAALQTQLADDSVLKQLMAQVDALQAAVKQKAALEKEFQETQRTISQSEARLTEIGRIAQEWTDEGAPALARVTATLEKDDFEPEARAAYAELAAAIEALDYDAAAHAAAQSALDALAHVPARLEKLQEAQATIKPLQEMIADLTAQIEDVTKSIAEREAQVTVAQAQLTALQADAAGLHAVEDTAFHLREEHIAASRKVGVAQQRVAVLDDRRAQRERLSAERHDTTQLIQRLKRLEEACGRNGVQALLIERALPEIEDSANAILDRLTSGRMRITFETQRQLKSRDELAETLDIHIVDEAGERPYENYSGGEQFRINFAIRLALSQILAKRAGAQLQTLVIDEGFGSQDPNGRQRLVEAINAIQSEFKRVLVITHIDELRDAFPVRIDVSKSAEGSQIRVS